MNAAFYAGDPLKSLLGMTPESVSALVSAIGVMVAIGVSVDESRRSRVAQEVTVLSQFDAKFESSEFRETRRVAAGWIAAGCNHDDLEGRAAASAVLNLFETIAYLHGRGAVTSRGVWNYFGAWLLPYFRAAQPLILDEQRSDPGCFKELPRLNDAVFQVERDERLYQNTDAAISPSAIKEFLSHEGREVRRSSTPGAIGV